MYIYIYNDNAQCKISPKWKYYDFACAINYTCKLSWVCACACVCDCMCLGEQYANT